MKKIKIIIADDHSIIRKGLRSLFGKRPEFSVVGEATNGRQAIELVREKAPDVAILDISMPEMGGIEATGIIKREFPSIGVLILTIYDSEEYVYKMVRAGANGYVLKDAGRNELFAAVRSVRAGDPFFSPGISRMMVDRFIRQARAADGDLRPHAVDLTRREKEILYHIASGLSNPRIAEKLFLSIRTINTHRANIMHKLDIHDVAGLVRYAVQTSLIKLPP